MPLMHRFTHLVVHHTAGPRSQSFESIREYHTAQPPNGRGYSDIAYHFVVLGDGELREGRPLPMLGAHAKGRNSTSIGLAIIGDNTRLEEEWTAVQLATAWRVVRACRLLFRGIRVVGHRDVMPSNYTECPGLDVEELFRE